MAYAVALQMLLTSVLVSQNVGALVSADPARVDIICFGAGGDGKDQGKSDHVARQNCCVLCNVAAGPALLAANVMLPRTPYGGTIVTYLPLDRAAPAAPQPTPRLSQGPPPKA